MNETLQVIQSRRSIRKYKSDPVPDSELEKLIQAAIYAPSAGNQQNWHFTVVRDAAMMGRLKEIMKANMLASGIEFLVKKASEAGFAAFYDAPVLIIITAEEKNRFSGIDCGAAAENIALAAEALGLGTCIMASSELIFAADVDGSLKAELGIPAGFQHVCALSVGYKDCEQPVPAPRKDNLVNYV